MNDDLERLISESLDERSAGAPASGGGGIDAVYARVAHRRARRRGVAAIGSVVLIGVGVIAIAMLGDDDPVSQTAAPPESASLEGALGGSWAEFVPAGTRMWRCSGNVMYGEGDGKTYWADCEQTTLDIDVGVMPDVVPTTISWTGDCLATTSVPGEPYATSAPCQFAPATTAPFLDDCVREPTTTTTFVTVPATVFPVSTICVPLGQDLPPAVTNPPVTTTSLP